MCTWRRKNKKRQKKGGLFIKRFIALLLAFSIFPLPVMAGDVHWAENMLAYVKRIDGISIDDPDSPASIVLQEKVFKLAGLDIIPQKGLTRYGLLKYMANELRLPEAAGAEVSLVLGDFIDVCDY